MMITLKAKTAEGFGGKDFYIETYKNVAVVNIPSLKVAFALKYKVSLDLVETIID